MVYMEDRNFAKGFVLLFLIPKEYLMINFQLSLISILYTQVNFFINVVNNDFNCFKIYYTEVSIFFNWVIWEKNAFSKLFGHVPKNKYSSL